MRGWIFWGVGRQVCCSCFFKLQYTNLHFLCFGEREREVLILVILGITAREWMMNKINRKIARADANNLPFGTRAQCERQKKFDRDVLGA